MTPLKSCKGEAKENLALCQDGDAAIKVSSIKYLDNLKNLLIQICVD